VYLVVFVTVQYLVGISAVVSIICYVSIICKLSFKLLIHTFKMFFGDLTPKIRCSINETPKGTSLRVNTSHDV